MSARDAFWFLAGALAAAAAAILVYPWLLTRHAVATSAAADAITAHMSGSVQSAGSMDNAVTALEQRLAKGGGSDADWELLARSYEFMQRPAAAAAARARRLAPGRRRRPSSRRRRDPGHEPAGAA